MTIHILNSRSSSNKTTVKVSSDSKSSTFNFNPQVDFKSEDTDTFKKLQTLTNYLLPISNSSNLLKDSGLLPPGLVYLTKNYLIFEKPPAYQNISLITKLAEEINYNVDNEILYRIPIPWQVYIVHYTVNFEDEEHKYYTSSVRMHFTDSPLMNVDQHVYMAPLTNFWTSGSLCRPMYDNMSDVEMYSKDIAGVIQSAYDWVWNSGTNLDLTDSIVNYLVQIKPGTPNSILQNSSFDDFPDYSFTSTYYCPPNVVNHFMKTWENIDINNVSSLCWPTNSRSDRFALDVRNATESRLSEYLRENFPDTYHGNSDCCDDCIAYDEDSNEYYSYDECECDCHNSDYDHAHFLEWAGVNPPKPITLKESFTNFVVHTSQSNPKYHGYGSLFLIKTRYKSVYQNIYDSILL